MRPYLPLGLILFVALTSVQIENLWFGRPALTLNDKGLIVGYPCVVTIAWREIEDVIVPRPGSTRRIQVKVSDVRAVVRRYWNAPTVLDRVVRFIMVFSYIGRPVTIQTTGFDWNPQRLAEEIKRRAAEARSLGNDLFRLDHDIGC